MSLDGLLDFIINESKILTNSSELQNILVNEFSRRFKEEYNKDTSTSPDRKLITSGSNNNLWNINNLTNNNNTNNKQSSFTYDLIFKLISNFIYLFYIFIFKRLHQNTKQLINQLIL